MSNYLVADYVEHSSQFVVFESDDLLKVINRMKKYSFENVSVVNEAFSLISHLKKQDIKEYIKTNYFLFGNIIHSLKNIKVKDLLKKRSMPLLFYPETKAEYAFSVMKYMNNNCAPVIKTPIDKKVIGFICLNGKPN